MLLYFEEEQLSAIQVETQQILLKDTPYGFQAINVLIDGGEARIFGQTSLTQAQILYQSIMAVQ